jgi:hypothetical protein
MELLGPSGLLAFKKKLCTETARLLFLLVLRFSPLIFSSEFWFSKVFAVWSHLSFSYSHLFFLYLFNFLFFVKCLQIFGNKHIF